MRRTIGAMVAVIAAIGTSTARAEPPPNDRPSAAMQALPLPFNHLADYTDATSGDDEPVPCWNPVAQLPAQPPGVNDGGQTLWYRYDAVEPIGLIAWGYRVVNENGFLDLGAYKETDDGLELIACVSSDPSSNWTDDILIRAGAGDSYLFMMSMNTYPDDTMASFHLRATTPVDLEARSLTVAPIEHETDLGRVSSGEEFDISFEVAAPTPDWYGASAIWTLDVCTKPPVEGAARCQSWTGSLYVPRDRPAVGSQRVTGLGVGDFEATLTVLSAGGIDLNHGNDQRRLAFSVLVEGLGFGV